MANRAVKATTTPGTKLTVASDGPPSVLEIIGRMSQMPNIPVAKLTEMLELQERIELRESRLRFNSALVTAQDRMRGIVADSENKHVKRDNKPTKYASYEALDDVIRPIYVELGFSLTYGTADSPKEDHVRVTADLSLGSYTKSYFVDMPVVTKGPQGGDVMTKTHATMSAYTYGRRALAVLIFNLVVRNDDDGNAAGGIAVDADPPLTPEHLEELMTYIAQIGANVEKVCQKCEVDRVQEIRESQLPGLRRALADWHRIQSRKKKPEA